jgi:hypothetical protein
MAKICQTGLLKLNFETRPKKRIYGFCQKFPQAMDEVEIFFLPISKSLGPYVVRDGQLYLKMWKKSKSLHPTVYHTLFFFPIVANFKLLNRWPQFVARHQQGTKIP